MLSMDNAPIHSSKQIAELIKSRNKDYKLVYLPPYSSELNPIEQFWVLIKGRVKDNKLQSLETLEKRIVEAAYEIPLQQLHSIVKHSKN